MRRPMIPWSDKLPRSLEGFSREMENLMERFFGGEGGGWGAEHFTPSANLAEADDCYEVTFDLPGMTPEDVNVELQEGSLIVSGERKEEKEEGDKTFHRIERSYGSFRRAITLPGAVNTEQVNAEFQDGVLKVTLPKTEAQKPKQIHVKGN